MLLNIQSLGSTPPAKIKLYKVPPGDYIIPKGHSACLLITGSSTVMFFFIATGLHKKPFYYEWCVCCMERLVRPPKT